ncbi:MAG: NAD(P)/FAD-dependent oxidoreductase [Gammaproteobacteria bacterium]|nr:NAD(P)/FAD-dependent oxidoreductase [Gammaproteobacteria bacterium]
MADQVPHPNRSKILVIGAGAAGLATAWTLAARCKDGKCRIRVLEASDRVGGRMFCEEIDGFHVNGGASVINESFATARDLARQLDVELWRSPKSKGGQCYAGGRFWGLYVGGSLKQTLQTLYTMFFSPQHTLAGNLEFMRLYAMLKKRARDLDFEDHSRMLDLDTGESFAEFARTNSFTRYLKQAGELDLNCFTAGSSEQVGAAYGMSLLWLWTFNPATRSCLPRQGISALANALAVACKSFIHVSTTVERIIVENGKVRGVVTASGEKIEADAVICATPASTAARIIPELPGELRAVLERISYSSCCHVAFGLDANILAEGSHAALFPPESPTFLTMVSNMAAMTPDAAPSGKTLVHALIIGEHARALFVLDDNEIVRRVLEEMRRYFRTMPEHPLFAKVYRWPEAFCLSPGGMLRDMQDMRIRLGKNVRGLYLAGDYTRLPSLNGAMKSGVDAAEASLAYVTGA